MSAIVQLARYLEVVSILPGDRLKVTLPSGSSFHFQYSKEMGKWREFLSVPSDTVITEEERQTAWEFLHDFFIALRA